MWKRARSGKDLVADCPGRSGLCRINHVIRDHHEKELLVVGVGPPSRGPTNCSGLRRFRVAFRADRLQTLQLEGFKGNPEILRALYTIHPKEAF